MAIKGRVADENVHGTIENVQCTIASTGPRIYSELVHYKKWSKSHLHVLDVHVTSRSKVTKFAKNKFGRDEFSHGNWTWTCDVDQ